MNIGIVGLGLIGGSMAKTIKACTGHNVYSIDIDSETMLLARMCGAIDGELTNEALSGCTLLFLALRPQASVDWVKQHAEHIGKGCIVVDLCGVKRAVFEPLTQLAAQHGFAYVGGHPMAGKERGGFTNSSATLYQGASMILTPNAATTPATLELLGSLFTDLGFARVVYSTPEEHDRIIAYTSQLAHIVSSAYVKSPEAQRQRGFSAGSFRDMTRVAYLDESMWTELFLDNADHLTTELTILIDHLTEYKQALETHDPAQLSELLRKGRESKIRAGGN